MIERDTVDDSPLLDPTAVSDASVHAVPDNLRIGGSELDLTPESLQVFRMPGLLDSLRLVEQG
jgi:hypothetical protein